MIDRPWIVLVGGFLGAGKTTLLLAAARELDRRNLRCALILNDQGDDLVDTELSRLHGLLNASVTGGCFCCRFSNLVEVIDQLSQYQPNVIFAEPVGSCADIQATTLLPLYEALPSCRIAPFTVLVDPSRLAELSAPAADPNLTYLFHKQLEEADLVCFTKSDLYPQAPPMLQMQQRQLSAKTGQGVAAWLDEVLSGDLSAGSKILDIDYDRYAQAEAALAWLNLQATLLCPHPTPPALVLGPLLESLDADLSSSGIHISHLKAVISSETGFIKAAIVQNGAPPDLAGNLTASPSCDFELLINLRATGPAATIRNIVQKNLSAPAFEVVRQRIQSFHPARPQPERRVATTLS